MARTTQQAGQPAPPQVWRQHERRDQCLGQRRRQNDHTPPDEHVATCKRATDNLFPLGRPQERVFSLVPYLIRHGPGLLDAILDEVSSALPPIIA